MQARGYLFKNADVKWDANGCLMILLADANPAVGRIYRIYGHLALETSSSSTYHYFTMVILIFYYGYFGADFVGRGDFNRKHHHQLMWTPPG